MRDSWAERIRRAETLAAAGGPAESLLAFYAIVLRAQQQIVNALAPRRPSGMLERDVAVLRDAAQPLFEDVGRHGPATLSSAAREFAAATGTVVAEALATCWASPCAGAFFPKAILQAYGDWLARANVAVRDREGLSTDRRCPRCGGRPQLSILEEGAAALESGGRQLQCATCLARWPYGRVRCAHCGEENEAKLGYFRSEEFAHLRIDSCDTCRRYLKAVDLGRLGLAVPLVDEVAGAALDAWAVERGYEKIEMNLVGM